MAFSYVGEVKEGLYGQFLGRLFKEVLMMCRSLALGGYLLIDYEDKVI